MNDLYQEIIVAEYQHPQHKGSLPQATHIGDGTNSSCGDAIKVYLQVSHEGTTPKVVDIAWEGEGCAISQATMSLLSQKIKREQPTLVEVKTWTKTDLLPLLGLDTISQAREKCLLIGLTTVQRAQAIKE